jgi:NADP-dependent 3-hydroxy acid dehydrogenase YdfG
VERATGAVLGVVGLNREGAAARVMVAQGRGMIVNISSRGAQQKFGALPFRSRF